jgi:hypothetical protein
MRPSLLLLFFFLFFSILPPLHAAPDQRLLVISTPSLNDDAYRTQAALLLPALAGLNERDFVVQIQFGTKSFSVVLIGKDGGEKLRRAIPLSPEELFAVVDAMPMRRAEMRERK